MAMQGVTAWTNPRNGFRIVQVHYTADPAKRTAEWITQAKQGMPHRGWMRELEISWSSPEGEPVIPEYDPNRHCRELRPNLSARLLRFWDFGYVTPAVIFAQLDMYGILRVLAELVPFNTPLESLIPMVKARALDLMPLIKAPFDAGDPAAGAETDLGSVKTILLKHGIVLATTRPGTDASYESLRARFRDSIYVPGVGLEPAIQIDPRFNKNLMEALAGAFHLSSHPPYRPTKVHPFKDIVDALRYGNDNLGTTSQTFHRDMLKLATIDRQW